MGQNQPAGSMGGAATASGGSSGTPARPGVPPNVISFPTSPAASPSVISLKLDKSASRDLLDGHEVGMMADFRGGKRAPELSKRVKKMAS